MLAIFDGVLVLAMDGGEPVDYLAIMGIRHVSGVRRWGPYQSAKLVSELRRGQRRRVHALGPGPMPRTAERQAAGSSGRVLSAPSPNVGVNRRQLPGFGASVGRRTGRT